MHPVWHRLLAVVFVVFAMFVIVGSRRTASDEFMAADQVGETDGTPGEDAFPPMLAVVSVAATIGALPSPAPTPCTPPFRGRDHTDEIFRPPIG